MGFYLKLAGQALLVPLTLMVVGLLQLEPRTAGLFAIPLFAWSVYLLAKLVGHLTRREPTS